MWLALNKIFCDISEPYFEEFRIINKIDYRKGDEKIPFEKLAVIPSLTFLENGCVMDSLSEGKTPILTPEKAVVADTEGMEFHPLKAKSRRCGKNICDSKAGIIFSRSDKVSANLDSNRRSKS
ncbi:hypothetical protein NPIL_231391 [Nephila pilipes]|uniref:Uncharacterized protein n=1 Tax=Nephila pilipes TaxID=299642 RepID=A0A8X6N1T2_NEPPI|nr:hypothetical protein NPIL_231391 [Nephila pilipes]